MASTEQVPIPQWTFGDRVRKVRRELRWSQRDLAAKLTDALGRPVSTKSVGAWEADLNLPQHLVDIAQALQDITGIPASWILGLDEEH